MSDVTDFLGERARLFSVAYRMLGSSAEAEDVVQDAYLRWAGRGQQRIDSPAAFLTTVVVRLSLDRLRSARHQRETYVGVWLPEPLPTSDHPVAEPDPADAAVLADSMSMAFLVLLETLTPDQRAAFLMREVLGYEYAQIAATLGAQEAACRQWVARAKRHIEAGRPRFEADAAHAGELAERFRRACADGDVEALLLLLADDATLWSDGGGKLRAAIRPVYGADRVSRFLAGIARKRDPRATLQRATLNGQPGLVSVLDGQVRMAAGLDIVDGVVCGVRIVVNPDKLTAVQAALGGQRRAAAPGAAGGDALPPRPARA